MEKVVTHVHSNISKIRSYGRNRRRENSTIINEQQQRVQQLINAKALEFQKKVEMIQQKMKEVKKHVRQTKSRLNSFQRYSD